MFFHIKWFIWEKDRIPLVDVPSPGPQAEESTVELGGLLHVFLGSFCPALLFSKCPRALRIPPRQCSSLQHAIDWCKWMKPQKKLVEGISKLYKQYTADLILPTSGLHCRSTRAIFVAKTLLIAPFTCEILWNRVNEPNTNPNRVGEDENRVLRCMTLAALKLIRTQGAAEMLQTTRQNRSDIRITRNLDSVIHPSAVVQQNELWIFKKVAMPVKTCEVRRKTEAASIAVGLSSSNRFPAFGPELIALKAIRFSESEDGTVVSSHDYKIAC